MITRRAAIGAGASWLAGMSPLASAFAATGSTGREGKVRLPCGRTLSYHEYGNPRGPLVFYFHGTPGSRYEAGLIADDACCAEVRLIAVDRPGMGCSTQVPCRRILDWPRDIVQLAKCLGYGDSAFGIVAMSGGAPYAAACALCIPERLTHVAIVAGHTPPDACGICPGAEDKKIALIANHQRLGRLGLELISRRLERRPDNVVEMVTGSWTAADKRLVLCNANYYRTLVANLRAATACGPDGVATDIRLLGHAWGFELGCVPGEKISLWQGGCDPIATPSMGRHFHRKICGSELQLDPRAGHVTMLKWHAREILARF